MKKKNAVVFICLLTLCGSMLAQPPTLPAGNPGERLRNDGDIPGAIAEFEKIYALNPRDQNNVYNLARALSINRQLDKCFQYLAIAVDREPSLAPLTDPDLVTAREDKRWGVFEDKLVNALNAKSNNAYKDIEYAKGLWKLRAWDQAFFIEVGIAGRKIGTHTRYNELTKKEELYPLENESKVNEWRKELGLPPIEEYLKQFGIVYKPMK